MVKYARKDVIKSKKSGVPVENVRKMRFMYLGIRDSLIKRGVPKPQVYGVATKITNIRAKELGWI